MRKLHIITGIDKALDKITLLKELLYPVDNFFQLTAIWKWSVPNKPQWQDIELSLDDDEIILLEGKEHFINKIHTAITPNNYIYDFNDVFNFLEEQIVGPNSLDAKFFGAIPITYNDMGEQYVFREVHDVEWIYINPPPSKPRGSVWHQMLFPIFWIWIEELNDAYDVWFQFGSRLWYPNQEQYVKYFTPEQQQANLARLCQYLSHFFERNLVYCQDVMLDPNENAENGKIAEFLKPIILQMLKGKITEIEILR